MTRVIGKTEMTGRGYAARTPARPPQRPAEAVEGHAEGRGCGQGASAAAAANLGMSWTPPQYRYNSPAHVVPRVWLPDGRKLTAVYVKILACLSDRRLVDTAYVRRETGLETPKICNILRRARDRGEVERVENRGWRHRYCLTPAGTELKSAIGKGTLEMIGNWMPNPGERKRWKKAHVRLPDATWMTVSYSLVLLKLSPDQAAAKTVRDVGEEIGRPPGNIREMFYGGEKRGELAAMPGRPARWYLTTEGEKRKRQLLKALGK